MADQGEAPVYSPAVSAITPMVQQVTGGNVVDTEAALSGAQADHNSFVQNIGATMASGVKNFLANIGMSPTTNPADIANAANTLGKTQSAAIMQAGGAQAQLDTLKGQQAGQVQQYDKATTAALGMDPNSPERIAQVAAIRDNVIKDTTLGNQITDMRNVGFFDNPGEYLVNHIIKIPYALGQQEDAHDQIMLLTGDVAAQNEALNNYKIADNAVVLKDTAQTTALTAQKDLANAAAQAVEPIKQSLQIALGAGQLAVSQANLGIAQADLQLKQAMAPIQQRAEIARSGYYEENTKYIKLKTSEEQQLIAKTTFENNSKQDQLTRVNGLQTLLGQQPIASVDKLNPVAQAARGALVDNLSSSNAFGQSPADSYRLLKSSGIPLNKAAPGYQYTFDRLDAVFQAQKDAIRNSPNFAQGKIKENELDGLALKATNDFISRETTNVTPNNLFFPTLSADISFKKFGATNPIANAFEGFTVGPDGKPSNRAVDGDMIMNTATQLMKTGKLDVNQAANAIVDLSKKFLEETNIAGAQAIFNIPRPQQYMMQYKTPTGNRASVNMIDIRDVMKKLTLQSVEAPVGDINNALKGLMP